nr:tyrosine-type recombinase/integrase [Paenibacillus sp. Marseille-Q4541]
MDFVIFNLKNGKQVLPNRLYDAFKRDSAQSNLPSIRFHDLRLSHATLLLTMNTNAKVVSESLGHSQVGVTLDTYSHVLRSVANEVAENLEQVVYLSD